MTTRRNFLQFLGIGGLVAAVHNVDALGLSVIEKKLIKPNYGRIRIYSGIGTEGTLLAILDIKGPLELHESLETSVIATGVATRALINHPKHGNIEVPIGEEGSWEPMTFDNPHFVVGGEVHINSMTIRPFGGRPEKVVG